MHQDEVENTFGLLFDWLLLVLLVALLLALFVVVLGIVSIASAPLWCTVWTCWLVQSSRFIRVL